MSEQYREKCLNRKGEFCMLCGRTEKIQVHHVDGDRANDDIVNLIAVCSDCHNNIHGDNLRYEMWRAALRDFSTAERSRRHSGRMKKKVTIKLDPTRLQKIDSYAERKSISRTSVFRAALSEYSFSESGIDEEKHSVSDEQQQASTEHLEQRVDELKSELNAKKRRIKSLENKLSVKSDIEADFKEIFNG